MLIGIDNENQNNIPDNIPTNETSDWENKWTGIDEVIWASGYREDSNRVQLLSRMRKTFI